VQRRAEAATRVAVGGPESADWVVSGEAKRPGPLPRGSGLSLSTDLKPSPRSPVVVSKRRRMRMPVSNTPIVERIARVIAGRVASINAEGDDASAAERVDASWRDYAEDARSILRTLREPDQAMATAGDPDMWERMVLAAIETENAWAALPPRPRWGGALSVIPAQAGISLRKSTPGISPPEIPAFAGMTGFPGMAMKGSSARRCHFLAPNDERPPGRPDGLSIASLRRLKSLGASLRGGRAHPIRRVRHVTMRHQTTSFQLLKHWREYGGGR
jgi:hypothetical protein